MNPCILIVDDETNLALSLADYLRHEGITVEIRSGVLSARKHGYKGIDLIVLDWSMPDGQGIDLLRDIRTSGNDVPVIMLTARAQLIDKILGLELGADDYLTKPFEPRELLARIRARLRQPRSGPVGRSVTPASATQANTVSAGGITIDLDSREVSFMKAIIPLTKMEWQLLKTLVENPNRVFSREELLNQVWGFENFPTTRTIDTHVLQLRQKFSADRFETVRGVGYRFCNKGD